MDEIRIPNDATYFPLPLSDIAMAAPLLSRVLLGATVPGRLLGAAAMGVYLGSALQDWLERWGVRRVDFRREFGADVAHLVPLRESAREWEVRVLVQRLNDLADAPAPSSRRALAVEVDRHLTDYLAAITGQRVHTSTEIRSFSLAGLIFPFAMGACDLLSGDVAIFKDTGALEPHVIAHEFTHRKGYWKELEAQALSYLALTSSGEPYLVRSALTERLHRDLKVLAGNGGHGYRQRVREAGLEPRLQAQLLALAAPEGTVEGPVSEAMRTLYDARMRLTGQNGLSDYDRGFTNFLHTFETSDQARQRPPAAGRIHGGAGAAAAVPPV